MERPFPGSCICMQEPVRHQAGSYSMILGCIGDDFTGSSDLANTLAKGGMRTVQYSGVPTGDAAPDVEAGVVALKSRTIPVAEAVSQSLAALEWLRSQGCRQFFFKYCSTFDSTDEGNIGPVGEAIARELGAGAVIVCPAFPATGRTVYQGHLFVNDRLLSESGMENHPLTPMRDADLRRVLARQTDAPVSHVPYGVVAKGEAAIADALRQSGADGLCFVITDAVLDADLHATGHAARDLPLITGGSGIALGLPENFRAQGLIGSSSSAWTGVVGRAAALAGSVSTATRRQVGVHRDAGHPTFELGADAVMAGEVTAASLTEWVLAQSGVPLIYSSADPETVAAAQQRHGKEAVATAIERLFAATAAALVEAGFTRLVSAGGETSGAVVTGLDVQSLEIGPEIDPGVPAVRVEGRELALALKSGNFGADDFFAKAASRLGGEA